MLSIFEKACELNSNNKGYLVWIKYNKLFEIYSPAVVAQKLEFVYQNTVVEAIVENAQDYLFSSAKDYYEGKTLDYLD